MKVPSKQFPGSGVTRSLCDHCKQPIIICWPGFDRDGEFCSNKCAKLALAEKENQPMSEETTGAETKQPPKKKQSPVAKPAKAKTKPAAAPKKPRSEEVFRAGSTKADIFKLLSGGTAVNKEKLYEVTDKAKKSRGLVGRVLKRAKKFGYRVNAEGDTVQLTAPKKAAA